MSLRYFANAPATTLASSCSSSATLIEVASTTGFPIQYPYTLILDRGTATEEAVSVTGAAGANLTVVRGIDGTTAFAHATSAAVEHGITAQDVREPNTHIDSDANVHGVAGNIVGDTDAQTLTNKTINLGANSVSMTFNQLNAAVSDADVQSVGNHDADITDLQNQLTAHEADTVTHGATGAIVGTTNAQTLSNKNLTATTTVGGTATVVGHNNAQALSNKDLTASSNVFPISIGSTTFTFNGSAETVTRSVVFAAGRFGSAPKVFVQPYFENAFYQASPQSVTADGCDIVCRRIGSVSPALTVTVYWLAVLV